jgi:N-acetylneuraminic acid mutarotase
MNANSINLRLTVVSNTAIAFLFALINLHDAFGRSGNLGFPLINSAPVFSSNNYNISASEEIALNSPVGPVRATDADGDAINYSIRSGNTNSAFSINATTGTIAVAKHLNHHTQNSYALVVRATDGGGLFDETNVIISVQAGIAIPSFTTIYWGTVAGSPSGTHEVHGEAVNGKLYIFGGYDVNKRPAYTPTKRAFVYDPVTNKWSSIASLPHTPNGADFGGITHEGMATDGTDIYFAGGYTSNSTGTGQLFGTKQVWRYNVGTNTYTSLPNLPIELATGQLRYLKGKLHYMGGANKARRDTTVHYALDLDNLAAGWKVLAPLIEGTNHPGSEVFEGKIYYISGSNGQDDETVTQNLVQVYDPNSNSWSLAANIPTARDHISSAVVVMGNRILVLGGETSHNIKTKLISAYTPATNTWSNITSLPVSKAAGVAAVLNGALFYTGGNFATTTYKGTIYPKIDSLTLINADTEQPIKRLKNGDVLNLNTLPTKNLNIKANTNPATIGSVKFNLTGQQNKTITESLAPYAFFGDNNKGDYYAWTPPAGNYTLTATPYTSSGGTGLAGTTISISFTVSSNSQSVTLLPTADAFVRNGSYSSINYGNETTFFVKGSTSTGYARTSYLKFSLNNISNVSSAKLRLYGNNHENSEAINMFVYGVNSDGWAENTITWNNAPLASTGALSSVAVNNQFKYYELDVTNFIQSQAAGDKIATFFLKDPGNLNRSLIFNSKENSQNLPQLVVENNAVNQSSAIYETLDILELDKTGTAKVYPNPAHSIINIELPVNYGEVISLQIADPIGRIYELGKPKLEHSVSGIKIDISKLSLKPGVYFIRVNHSLNQTQTIKVIIK